MISRVRDALEWCAYRSPWGRFINWAGYWLTYGETRAQGTRRDLAFADRLDAGGYSVAAESFRSIHGCPLCRDGDPDIGRYHDCDSAVGR